MSIGTSTESYGPREIRMMSVVVESTSVGVSHAVCVLKEGRVSTWVNATNGRLSSGVTAFVV